MASTEFTATNADANSPFFIAFSAVFNSLFWPRAIIEIKPKEIANT